jgi:hypothetical protein
VRRGRAGGPRPALVIGPPQHELRARLVVHPARPSHAAPVGHPDKSDLLVPDQVRRPEQQHRRAGGRLRRTVRQGGRRDDDVPAGDREHPRIGEGTHATDV